MRAVSHRRLRELSESWRTLFGLSEIWTDVSAAGFGSHHDVFFMHGGRVLFPSFVFQNHLSAIISSIKENVSYWFVFINLHCLAVDTTINFPLYFGCDLTFVIFCDDSIVNERGGDDSSSKTTRTSSMAHNFPH